MNQTIALLQTCNSGVKTAVNSLENALRKSKGAELTRELERSLATHRVLGNELHEQLQQRGATGKEPSAMARVMAQGKMNMKYLFSPTDETVAALVCDGCNMGTRTVCHEDNRRPDADEAARNLARRITATERETAQRLERYL